MSEGVGGRRGMISAGGGAGTTALAPGHWSECVSERVGPTCSTTASVLHYSTLTSVYTSLNHYSALLSSSLVTPLSE